MVALLFLRWELIFSAFRSSASPLPPASSASALSLWAATREFFLARTLALSCSCCLAFSLSMVLESLWRSAMALAFSLAIMPAWLPVSSLGLPSTICRFDALRCMIWLCCLCCSRESWVSSCVLSLLCSVWMASSDCLSSVSDGGRSCFFGEDGVDLLGDTAGLGCVGGSHMRPSSSSSSEAISTAVESDPWPSSSFTSSSSHSLSASPALLGFHSHPASSSSSLDSSSSSSTSILSAYLNHELDPTPPPSSFSSSSSSSPSSSSCTRLGEGTHIGPSSSLSLSSSSLSSSSSSSSSSRSHAMLAGLAPSLAPVSLSPPRMYFWINS
mmetsp:Transcript_23431/g.48679  ORF Transcript_23431/g.48679 Transcript_23431/m.48679 type:complete len:327 (-) Transcript_23431:639-1619(-)